MKNLRDAMKTEPASKLISCILPQGKGVDIIERLSNDKGIHSANVSSGRGRGAGNVGAIGAWDEIDMLSVVVPEGRADEIFDFIFEMGELGRPRGGIMFQHAVSPSTAFALPELKTE